MSRIDDILLEIKNYLADEHQGNDLKIREYTAIYAAACQDINSKLAECSKLIANNLMADAQRLNAEMRPTLCSRAGKLAMTGKQKLQYDRICKLYDYTPAPDIDTAVVKKLRSDSSNGELTELIQQWRKIARGKDNAAKISLLREIITLAPADVQTYRSNLQALENQYIAELQAQANVMLSAGDGEKLMDLYKFLNDPDFLTPIQDDILQQYRPLILRTRKAKFSGIVQQKCQDIFSAYSAMDVKLAKSLLEEYDNLTKDVLFEPDKELDMALDDVRNFVRETEVSLQKSADFANKTSELVNHLDQRHSYEIIENLYESIRQMDMPIDEVLTRRVLNRREEYIMECNRRHTRKCIYGILLAIVLVALGFLTFKVIQSYRSFVHHREAMTKLMAEKNYEGVITLFNKIESETPLVLSFGDLDSFKLEAERLAEEHANNLQTLNDLCNAADNVLKNQPVDLPELRKIYDSIQAILPNVITPPELAERVRRIDADKSRLETIEQNRINREFLASFNEHAEFLKSADRQLNSPYCDLPDLKINITAHLQQVRNLLQTSPLVSENMLKSSTALIDSLEQSINAKYEHAEAMYELTSQLAHPSGIQHYIELITSLPTTAPEFAKTRWRYAMQNIEVLKNIVASTQLRSNIYSWKALEREITQKKIQAENNPFILDYIVLLAPKDFSARVTDLGNQFKSDPFLKQFINPVYEFIFKAENGNIWRFYAANKPFIDRMQGMPAPKAIALDAIKKSGAPGITLHIQVNLYIAEPEFNLINSMEGVAHPNKFVSLLNMDLRSNEAPLAVHCKMYADFIEKLQYIDSPEILEESVIAALNDLRKAVHMNPVVKLALARKLLEFLPLVSQQGYSLFIERYVDELDNIADNVDPELWCHPAFEADHPEEIKQLNNFFEKLDLNAFVDYNKIVREYHSIAVSRKLSPVGVVMTDEQNKLTLNMFDSSISCEEYWFYLQDPASGKYHWYLFTAQELRNGLPADKFALHNGDVIFMPGDNRNTLELTGEYSNKIKNTGVKTLIWPACWPVNIR